MQDYEVSVGLGRWRPSGSAGHPGWNSCTAYLDTKRGAWQALRGAGSDSGSHTLVETDGKPQSVDRIATTDIPAEHTGRHALLHIVSRDSPPESSPYSTTLPRQPSPSAAI